MKIYELLSEESKWFHAVGECSCDRCIAANEKGRCVALGSKFAVKWTLWGAIRECYSGGGVLKVYRKLRDKLNTKDLYEWNNHPDRTYAEVFQLVKELDI